MGAVLTVGALQKPAAGRSRFSIDFGNEPLLIGDPETGDGSFSISSFDVTTSGTGAPTISAKQLDYPFQLSALFEGGTAGSTYDVVFSITLDDPDASVLPRTTTMEIL